MGQFLTLKNMVAKFFRNSNFSDFLGIKSEINQFGKKDFEIIEDNKNYVIRRIKSERNDLKLDFIHVSTRKPQS